MLNNPVVDVWAHPFRYAAKRQLEINEAEVKSILAMVNEKEVLFEINLSDINGYMSLKVDKGPKKIIGYDLHDTGVFL